MNTKERTEHRANNFVDNIPAEKLTIQEIPSTIATAYIEGAYAMEQDYRKAILEYCRANDLDFTKVFPQILKILSK